MKRVLYITDYVDIGGGESSLLNIMNFYKENHIIEPILLVPSQGEITEFCEQYSITYIVYPFNRFPKSWIKFIPLINPKATLNIANIIKRHNIDLIHVNSIGASLVNSLVSSLITKTNLVWTCHGWWEKPYGLRAKVLNLFVDKVFAVSNYVKSYIDFPQNKVKTTYLGIDINKFSVKEQDVLINKPKKIVGMIGRYQPVKGQHLFVEVAERILSIPKYRDTLTFVLIGDVNFSKEYNSYKDRVIEKINNSKYKKSFILKGFEKNIESYYDEFDVLVVPSEFESFSMVTLEGLAKGLLVVATNKGGPAEIIEDEISGLLFESGNSDDLYQKVIHGLNVHEKYSFEARRRAGNFSIEKIGIDYLSEYNKLWGSIDG
ncbi:glycosyltransferase family 4 protein [Bacillus sp. EB106-08-02-XG196]|uniref:glycosyltransferase family 4 protein n=1 Tax=Bacillus sp. EB106-08-02-XG196 TaxID=2737049 RepID=UPI0015C471E6|nr:glycosyltransferase family 4 protein [Bacillus sp. EB106-08-02-XG196]NWQ39503.1 glycosyltransferase family 4 protein [Bacillus sp. EB106-08-02-XG196]